MMRRRILTLQLTLIAALALTTGGSQADEADDVPMFRGNAARTGEMPGPGPEPDPAHGVRARWRFATGDDVFSSPAVVDGVVYIGSNDTNVYALNAATGTEQWRFATGGFVIPSPAVVDGVVYVGSWDNNLYALDAATGTERWRFATGDDVYSSPAVVDGVVYVGSDDTNLYALDAATGTEWWRFATGDNVLSSPAVVDGVVYAGSGDGNVYALEAAQPVLETDATAEVTVEGPAVRGGPAGTAVVRAELDKGTRVTITGEAVLGGETEWWPVAVDDTGTPGWIEGQRLRAVWPE